jgi:alcohol dehydrogenase (cytochrome c)
MQFGAAAMLAAAAAACSHLEDLPFLKHPVDNAPHGSQSTEHGPVYSAGYVARYSIDTTVDWGTYNNTFSGTRFSPLAQITTANAGSLRPLCTAELGEQAVMQSGPIVIAGVMYVTSAISTWAIDATNCRVRWKHTYKYSPRPEYDLKVNRGVALLNTPAGPTLFRGANDGRLYAIDVNSGLERWNVKAGDVARGETFPAAPIAWHGLVFIGNAGGDNFGVKGRMMAFDAQTGARVWSVEMIPSAGPADTTWPGETADIPRAGGTSWTSYSLDTTQRLLYVPTGNAAPDFLAAVRPGSNKNAYSIVAIDPLSGELRRAYQLLQSDFHDWDVAAAPLLLTTGAHKNLIAVAGKDGHLYGIDPASGAVTYKTEITTVANANAPLTAAGTHFCPGIQGGVEWNGPAFSPATNMLYVGAVDWCSTVQLAPPQKLISKLALPWTGSAKLAEPFGKMDPKERGAGWLTAVDADNGAIRWRYHSPTPLVAGVTATAGGLVFIADLTGNVIAFDAASGAERFRTSTGQPVGGGIVSYAVNGRQYIAVVSGLNAPKTWQVKSSAAKVVVLSLP